MVLRATVVRVQGALVYVSTPTGRGQVFEHGPYQVYLTAIPAVGTKVLVTDIGGNSDDLVVFARM